MLKSRQLLDTRKSFNKGNLIVFAVLCASLGSYFAYGADAVRAPRLKTSKTTGTSSLEHTVTSTTTSSTAPTSKKTTIVSPNLTLQPASLKVSRNTNFSVAVWADTNGKHVNAVQANLSYPADKLELINISDAGSAFGVKAQAAESGGTVLIARGNIQPLTGRLLVATVTFRVKATSRVKAAVNFAPGTQLVSSDTNTNILSATYGGSYNLVR